MSGSIQTTTIFHGSFSTLVVALLVGLATCAYFLFRRNPRLKRHLDALGGPPGWPLFGNALTFISLPHEDIIGMLEKWSQEYGPVFGAWIGYFIPYVPIFDCEVAENVLSGMSHITKGKYDYSLLHPWLGSGLLTASKKKWAPRRKLLTPSFHFKILEDFMPIFNEQASVFLQCLEGDKRDDGRDFDVYPYITKCTLDVICETAMGKKINAQTNSVNEEYTFAVNRMSELLLTKLLKPWLRIPAIYYFSPLCKEEDKLLGILHGFTESVIQSRKLERSKKAEKSGQANGAVHDELYGKKRTAFLDMLLDAVDNGEALSDEDIREEVDTFMFEGHDTTGVNIGWTIFMLATHPECQKLVQKELDELFGNDIERDVTTTDCSNLKYLEYCIKETLRLFPSVPYIMRTTDSDIVLKDGRIIPEGATALVGIYNMNRDPKHFPDPLTFKPERFTLDNSIGRHPYAFVPFSAGPRSCIGQKFAVLEEKVVLAKLLRKYWIDTDETMEAAVAVPDIVLRKRGGIQVRLHMRTLK